MGDLIHAIYEDGVFKPTERVDLPVHCPVMVSPINEAEEFWIEKSVDQLAAEQGVQFISEWKDVFGSARQLWETEESFDSFLKVA